MKKILKILLFVVLGFMLVGVGVFAGLRISAYQNAFIAAQTGNSQYLNLPPNFRGAFPPGKFQQIPGNLSTSPDQNNSQGRQNWNKQNNHFGSKDDQGGRGFNPGRMQDNRSFDSFNKRDRWNNHGMGSHQMFFIPILFCGLFGIAILALIVWGIMKLLKRKSKGMPATAPVTNISCSNCGKPLQSDWSICPHCSTPVEKSDDKPGESSPSSEQTN